MEKDVLKILLLNFSEEQEKGFKLFLSRNKKKQDRKDYDLFKLLITKPLIKSEELKERLYPEAKNMDAFYALKKRLLKQLTQYISFYETEADHTEHASVMQLVNVSKYLFRYKHDLIAWKYLQKAESIAKKNELFETLHQLYQVQIEFSDKEGAADINLIIKQYQENKRRVEEDERAAIACSLIKKLLKESKKTGNAINFEQIIQMILTSYQLHDILAHRPKLLFNILSITRSQIKATKDYFSFEPYVLEQFQQLDREKGFSPASHYYKLEILYMISHVLYRNRKLTHALEYVDKLKNELEKFNSIFLPSFYARVILLQASIEFYLGNASQAEAITLNAIQDKSVFFNAKDRTKALLNVSIYQFYQKKYSEAIRTELSIGHTDKWFLEHMGQEWLFKKQLMEAIAQIEIQNIEIALNKIRSIERNFRDLFRIETYRRAKVFMEILKKFANTSSKTELLEMGQKAEMQLVNIPEEKEDIQAMAFYGWLKAKLLNEDPYETLLEIVRN